MVDNKNFILEFSNIINELRIEKGLTIEQLAELASVHRTTIGLIIRTERSPSLQMAKQICNALDVKLSFVIKKIEDITEGKLNENCKGSAFKK